VTASPAEPTPRARAWERFTLAGHDPAGLTPGELLRFRTLSIGLAIFMLVMTGYITHYFVRDARALLPGACISFVYAVALYGVLWRTGATRWVGFGVVAGFLLLSFHDAVVAGGVGAPGYAWVSVTPLLAGLIQGQREGFIWWVVCGFLTAGLLAWEHVMGPVKPALEPQALLTQGVAEMVGLYIMSGAALFFYTRVIDRQSRELAQTVLRLEAEVEVRRRAEVEAQAASKAKGAFLATMSHEIRTPMNGVIGMTDLLIDSPLSDEQREYAETLRASADSLLVLINDILDLSKAESGRLELEEISFRPRSLLRDVLNLLLEGARKKGLYLELEVAPDVPVWLVGDAHRLRQMITNLAANAVKFTERGKVLVRAATRPGEDGALVLRIEVVDTGIGLEPQQAEQLFQPFVQADSSTSRRFGGTGLGLAIVRSLAQHMRGQVGVTSAPGVGSTFWFEAQVRRGEGPSATPPMPMDSPLRPEELAKLKLLVVEDNAVNRKVVTRMLDTMQVQYTVAVNGEEAVRKVAEEAFDAVLMDCQMPVMDGYEATRQIRAREATQGGRVAIYGLSANAMPSDRDYALEIGMDLYLTKPLKKLDLLLALARLTGSSRARGA
jgi:signal transduction histidine kinase/CheY-like chemotaxis protein